MKNLIFLFTIFLSLVTTKIAAQFNFQRSWGTYFGDERFVLSDSEIDSKGNLYIVGTINGTDLTNITTFTNNSSHHQNFGGGDYDGFLIKFNNLGQIVWGTFLGGSGFDRISDLDIDNSDNLYIVGSTNSNSNIASVGAFQENLIGGGDCFITKFTSTGSVVWSTYFGGTGDESNTNNRITFDGLNNFYIVSTIFSPNMATVGVFQETKNNSSSQISKFDINGNRIWTTYYGLNTTIWNIKANPSNLYVASTTNDCLPSNSYNTYFGTPNSYQPTPGSCKDIFLTKFNTTGQRDWSTYYGGNGIDNVEMKNSIDLKDDKVYLSGTAPNYSNQEITTNGTYQPNSNAPSNFIVQFNQNGARNWGTYNGNFINNSTIGSTSYIKIDKNSNNFYNYGSTAFQTNIATNDGYLVNTNDLYSADAYICKFSDQNTKSWGTYYGGELNEKDINFHQYNLGNKFYIVGSTQSLTQIASPNGLQPNKQVFDLVNNTQQSAYSIFIAHFIPNALSNETFTNYSFSIFPNPNNGEFTVEINSVDFVETSLEVFDMLGKLIYNQNLNSNQTTIYTKHIEKGVYLVKLTRGNQTTTSKIVIN
jgi:hypothetical protein